MNRSLRAFLVEASVLVLVLAAATPATALAQSGLQVTPDGKRVLVSKNVGAERWALTRNLADGSVTGNVFTTGGGDPQFVACTETGRSGGDVALRCEGADRCLLTPCTRDEWVFIADVTLPASFFEPGSESAATASAQRFAPRSLAGVAGAPNQPAGVQNAPDASAALVNKDVGGGQRWAITLNFEDNTVTGNVFFPGGDDPAFVWCEKKGFDGEELLLSCFGSDRCAVAGCSPEDWQPLFDVPIAEDFFFAPDQVGLATLDEAVTLSLGSVTAFDALILAFGQGYSFRQIADAGLAGRIRPPGDLVDRHGEILPPAEPPYHRTDTPAGLETPSDHIVRFDPGAVRDRLKEVGVQTDIFVTSILFMLNRGYTPRQILEAVEEDRIAARASGSPFDSFIIVDDMGRPIPPLPVDVLDVFLPPELGSFECGNGIVDPGESCEAGVAVTQSCRDYGFDGGELGCVERLCRYDTQKCRKCGNGFVEPGEECDGSSVGRQTCRDLGIDVPLLPGCTSECTIDDRPCRMAVEDGCPDGNLDPGEDCDGAFWSRGTQCSSVGEGMIGDLICNRLTCTYDTRLCSQRASSGCGNGRLDDGEPCDASVLRVSQCTDFDRRYVSGALGCNEASCTYDTSACEEASDEPGGVCGDGVVDGGEECEAGQLGGSTCQILGFGPGSLRCDEDCDFDTGDCEDPVDLCGNGIVDPDEDCDGGIFAGLTCSDVDGRFVEGMLSCTDDCRFDTGDCEQAMECDEATCPDGSCTPFGADCCGGGFFCSPGSVCAGDGCCPEEFPARCTDGKCVGDPGECCEGTLCDGTCFEAPNLVCCDDGGACPFSLVCVDGGCCPGTLPQACPSAGCAPAGADCCGEDSFCPLGSFCEGGDSCCGNVGSICGIPQMFTRSDREQPAM